MGRIKGVNLYILDMEWSQTKGMIQPLELAVIPVETDENIFFRYIRPEDAGRISQSAYKLLKINKNKIKGAPEFRTVIRELRDYTGMEEGRKNIAVIWHDTTKENFIDACKRNGVRSPFSKMVSLREVLVTVQKRDKNKNSFERLLYEYNIEFDKDALHNAGYDARHLKQLFLAVRDKAAQYEPHQGLISNTGSGIIHSGSCRYCKDMTAGGWKDFDMDDLYRGYRICKACGKNIHPWIPAPTKEEIKFVEIMENIGNIGDGVTEHFISKKPEKPGSCVKLRDQYKQQTAEFGCSCVFKKDKNCYPSPVLHAISLSPDAPVQVTLPTSRTLTKEKETKVKAEMNIHTKAQELAGRIFEAKKQKRAIDKDINKLERELGALFDAHKVESLELPMGILTRRKKGDEVEWVIEI